VLGSVALAGYARSAMWLRRAAFGVVSAIRDQYLLEHDDDPLIR
jgi:hypothetical protein